MPRYPFCPNCGKPREVFGEYIDARQWERDHLSGACSAQPAPEPEKEEKP